MYNFLDERERSGNIKKFDQVELKWANRPSAYWIGNPSAAKTSKRPVNQDGGGFL
jgi:hypothetical protein